MNRTLLDILRWKIGQVKLSWFYKWVFIFLLTARIVVRKAKTRFVPIVAIPSREFQNFWRSLNSKPPWLQASSTIRSPGFGSCCKIRSSLRSFQTNSLDQFKSKCFHKLPKKLFWNVPLPLMLAFTWTETFVKGAAIVVNSGTVVVWFCQSDRWSFVIQ